MPYILLAVLFVAASYSGSAHAGGDFPELRLEGEVPNGFVLRLQDGPDFYVWRCELPTAPNDATPGFGIYFGLHPSSSAPDSGVTDHPGSVVGKSVRWQQWHDGALLRREALLDYQHSVKHLTLKLHVFITARSKLELDTLLEALEHLRFAVRSPNAA